MNSEICLDIHNKYFGAQDKYIKNTKFDDFSEVPRSFQRIETENKAYIMNFITGPSIEGQVHILPEIPITNLKLRVPNQTDFDDLEIILECGGVNFDRVTMDTLKGNILLGLADPIENVDGYTWISLPFAKKSWVCSTEYHNVKIIIKTKDCDLDCVLFADVLQFQGGLPDYECLVYQNQHVSESFPQAKDLLTRVTRSTFMIKYRLAFNHPACALFVYVDTKSVNDIPYLIIGDTKIPLVQTHFGYKVEFPSTINFSRIDTDDTHLMIDVNETVNITVHIASLQVVRYTNKMFGLRYSK